MRQSLEQYLKDVLQDAEVRPEQNVDESHPVDIKITWALCDQRAIIEVKWLGASLNQEGQIGTCYSEQRARDGAQQLADYLDSCNVWGSGTRTRGYLVVFDGRRRLDPSSGKIKNDDILFYKDKDIQYDPDFCALREDFDAPTRFYMHPVI